MTLQQKTMYNNVELDKTNDLPASIQELNEGHDHLVIPVGEDDGGQIFMTTTKLACINETSQEGGQGQQYCLVSTCYDACRGQM